MNTFNPSAFRANLKIEALNWFLLIVFFAIYAVQFFILPFYVVTSPAAVLALIFIFSLTNNSLWSLMHDSLHGSASGNSKRNEIFGTVIGYLFCSPFHMNRIGHLLHHKLNRGIYERAEVRATKPGIMAQMEYYFNILGGTFIKQILFPLFIMVMPRQAILKIIPLLAPGDGYDRRLATSLADAKNLSIIRRDFFIINFLLAISFYLYGQNFYLVLVILLLRAFFISFLDYIYHYRTSLNDVLSAKNLRFYPKVLEKLILNFNYHGVHHQHPQISWLHLPRAFTEKQLSYEGEYLSTALGQLQGLIEEKDLQG